MHRHPISIKKIFIHIHNSFLILLDTTFTKLSYSCLSSSPWCSLLFPIFLLFQSKNLEISLYISSCHCLLLWIFSIKFWFSRVICEFSSSNSWLRHRVSNNFCLYFAISSFRDSICFCKIFIFCQFLVSLIIRTRSSFSDLLRTTLEKSSVFFLVKRLWPSTFSDGFY